MRGFKQGAPLQGGGCNPPVGDTLRRVEVTSVAEKGGHPLPLLATLGGGGTREARFLPSCSFGSS